MILELNSFVICSFLKKAYTAQRSDPGSRSSSLFFSPFSAFLLRNIFSFPSCRCRLGEESDARITNKPAVPFSPLPAHDRARAADDTRSTVNSFGASRLRPRCPSLVRLYLLSIPTRKQGRFSIPFGSVPIFGSTVSRDSIGIISIDILVCLSKTCWTSKSGRFIKRNEGKSQNQAKLDGHKIKRCVCGGGKGDEDWNGVMSTDWGLPGLV